MTFFMKSFKVGKSLYSNVLASEIRVTSVLGHNIVRCKGSDDTNNDTKKSDEKTVEDIVKQNEQLLEENQVLKDKFIRSLAEMENTRKQAVKQIADAKIYAIQGFCKDLLDVADSLGKATELVPKEEVSDRNPHLKHLYEGLVSTESQLQTIFQRHGLVSVNPLNEEFDPNEHKALFEQVVEGKKGGLVVVVSQIGYKLHNRVIRAAAVGISKDANQ
ncbi:grpE protein homolog 1, mitochondrial-like [Adelges cooleyi]|uniref:grpE protein homolog 1, mitochondrial-like n=1 Tax=Adelges cooleyi TaxID=133065 RepID=UPI00217FB855|nr:grpE protein homolog 1, mitochondrial-like [Adelges cooleyi]